MKTHFTRAVKAGLAVKTPRHQTDCSISNTSVRQLPLKRSEREMQLLCKHFTLIPPVTHLAPDDAKSEKTGFRSWEFAFLEEPSQGPFWSPFSQGLFVTTSLPCRSSSPAFVKRLFQRTQSYFPDFMSHTSALCGILILYPATANPVCKINQPKCVSLQTAWFPATGIRIAVSF